LHFHSRFGERLYGKYGFKDAFNLTFADGPSAKPGWFDDQYVAIDQGPILLMIENFRTGRIWSLMKTSPYIRAGLVSAGFTGGWLDGGVAALASSATSSPLGAAPRAACAVKAYLPSNPLPPGRAALRPAPAAAMTVP
jgi:hypothetical protein